MLRYYPFNVNVVESGEVRREGIKRTLVNDSHRLQRPEQGQQTGLLFLAFGGC